MTPDELDEWWENERKKIKPLDSSYFAFVDMKQGKSRMDKRVVAPWFAGS